MKPHLEICNQPLKQLIDNTSEVNNLQDRNFMNLLAKCLLQIIIFSSPILCILLYVIYSHVVLPHIISIMREVGFRSHCAFCVHIEFLEGHFNLIILTILLVQFSRGV